MYNQNGAEIAPGDVVVQIPMEIENPSEIKVQDLLVIGNDNRELTDLEAVTTLKAYQQFPTDFALGQNYPNPFNPSTSIEISLPRTSQVQIMVYNILGQEVRRLFSGLMERGTTTLRWDGKDQNGRSLASGTYIYRMRADNFVQTKKMTILK